MKVYVVEGDEDDRQLLMYALTGRAYLADGCASGAQLQELLRRELPDLILLDVSLPDEDGLAVLRRLKSERRTAQIPVILLTAQASEMDTIIGLDAGADDYISKPFGILELLSRVNAILRRTERTANGSVSRCRVWEDVVIDPDRHHVTLRGEEVHLTKKEFRLLWYLLENQGHVVTRERIMEYVWDCEYDIETRTIDIHINTLRKKLEDNGTMIQTIRGYGYKIS